MLASSQPLLVRQVPVRPLAWAVVVGIAAYGAVAPLLAVAHELIVLGAAHLVGDAAWLDGDGRAVAGHADRSDLHQRDAPDPRRDRAARPGAGRPGRHPAPRALAGPLRVANAGRVARLDQRGRRAGLNRRQSLALRHRRGRHARRARTARDSPGSERAHLARRLRRHRSGTRRRHPFDRAATELADVEAAGIPFAVAMLVSGDVQAGPRLAESLERLVDPLQGAVLGLGMVTLAYLPVILAVLIVAAGASRLARRSQRPPSARDGLVVAGVESGQDGCAAAPGRWRRASDRSRSDRRADDARARRRALAAGRPCRCPNPLPFRLPRSRARPRRAAAAWPDAAN